MKRLGKIFTLILIFTVLMGNVAYAQKKHVKARKATQLECIREDEHSFTGEVKIKLVTKKSALRYGKSVTLKADVKGAKKGSYILSWETRKPGEEEWTALDSENGKTLTFTLTKENAQNEYRVAVTAK